MMATSCFTDERNKMYISRWMTRGIALAVAALLVPITLGPIVSASGSNDGNYMLNVVVALIAVTLFVLAWGQLQYAYHLFGLNRLLHAVANGRSSYRFTLSRDAVATVTRINRQFRVEVIAKESAEVTIYVVSNASIQAWRLTGALSVVPAYGFSQEPQLTFEEQPLQLDYRREMHFLKNGLQATLPHLPYMRRFTP